MATSTGSKTWSKKQVGHLLVWWGNQKLHFEENSPLGFPTETVEAKMMVYGGRVDGRPATSIVPDIPMSLDFIMVDRIMEALTGLTREVTHWHYLQPGSEQEKKGKFCAAHEISPATYRNRLDRGEEAVQTCLNRDLQECA